MSQPEQRSRLAVLLFTDMVDSVALERRLGTEPYSRLLKHHHELLLRALEIVQGGAIRNDTGDGVLCEFGTATDAVNAALLFQWLLRDAKWESETPKVRIGIHQGLLAEFQLNTAAPGKLVGLPVSIASRVMSLAQAGQILMTRPVHDDARQFVREHPLTQPGSIPPPLRWLAHGEYLFKGSDQPLEIYEVGIAKVAPFTAPPNTGKARAAKTATPTASAPSKPAPVLGAVLTVLCGLLLWSTPFGDGWVNASYDYLFRFSSHSVTNKLAVILMDKEAHDALGQSYDKPWSRALHTRLLQQLADAGCPLVVFDVHFQDEGDRDEDAALANAMRRQQKLVLMTDLADPKSPHLAQESIVPPHKTFVAVATNLGVGNAGVELLSTPRRLWPFPFTSELPSLPLVAARAAGVAVDESAGKRWLRYYGKAWDPWTYSLALSNNSVEYYRDRVVFIGQGPERANDPGYQELDKFSTPFTRWNSTSVGGVEILATTYLNLVNGDWLRRFAWPVELLILVLSGAALGGGLGYFRHGPATLLALGLAVGVLVVSVALTHLTNYWFPWLIIAGGQLPCALLRALLPTRPAVTARRPQPAVASEEVPAAKTVVINQPGEPIPNAPEYDVITPHIGEGGFGKVWIARNALGQWQALKAVYEAHFKGNRKAYEAEFNGLQKYKPISEKHPGLLRIDLVSRMKPEGYFYYVMELGDAMAPGWENRPQFYKTRDLESLRKQAYGHRLPPAECLRIVSVLAEALQFLHENGLTHRDIKPSNVIFVNACPKLADVGLVTNIKPDGVDRTLVGTPGYMPPPPERPGTVQADIFSLGMLLYVISTGREPELFPSLGTALVEDRENEGFMQLNAIILKACQPDLTHRYGAAAELLAAARQALRNLPA